jgi:hypothetical protein
METFFCSQTPVSNASGSLLWDGSPIRDPTPLRCRPPRRRGISVFCCIISVDSTEKFAVFRKISIVFPGFYDNIQEVSVADTKYLEKALGTFVDALKKTVKVIFSVNVSRFTTKKKDKTMPAKDFIPCPDAAFNNWQYQLADAIGSHATAWGIPAAAITQLQNQRANWDGTYSWITNPATKTKPRVLAKNEARKEYVAFLRKFLKQYITYNPAVSDEQRVAMGLPVHDTKPTPVPPPSTMPVGKVDISVHRRHTIRVQDSVHTGRGKPPGVHGFEAWRKIGGSPPR